MVKAEFIFTKYQNSFSVKVQNLEQLSVEQIQEIENFVRQRKGIFDFETYTFVIQKKLEFEEFTTLLQFLKIEAKCRESDFLSVASEVKISFGKHKGMYYSELPDSYISWLKVNYRGDERRFLDAELKRRKL
jgi:hypothetical protein